MLHTLSDLKLGRARNIKTWEGMVQLFQPRPWSHVQVHSGRMAYTLLENNTQSGRELALVMLEDAEVPAFPAPSGSVFFTICGQLQVVENDHWVKLEPWDLGYLGGSQLSPYNHGFYLGLWAFPEGAPLFRLRWG